LPEKSPSSASLRFAPGQIRKGVTGAWLIISLAGLGCVLFSLLAPARTVLDASPQCLSMSLYGEPCPACGMTRGFVAMSRADLAGAKQSNPAAPYLYILFTLNGLAAVVACVRLARGLEHAAQPRPGLDKREVACKFWH
jgi:hypothetical protein